MGFFNFLKKNKRENVNTTRFDIHVKTGTIPTSKPSDDLEHLTKEGELPFGWVWHNREFTEKIGGEYSYFLNLWLNARKKSPKELYSALKSFVLYLEDIEKLCKSKGECFEFWYYNILTAPDYLEKRKLELQRLSETLEEVTY